MSGKHTVSVLAVILSTTALPSLGQNPQTVFFQQGIDGYAGQVDMAIKIDDSVTMGSTTPQYFLDGGEDDTHALIRFDDIFGDAPGQIPLGATILGASLDITTGNQNSAAPTNGPYYVSALLEPFDENTVYSDYSGLDANNNGNLLYLNGHSTRPAGGFTGSRYDDIVSANVLPLIQSWSDGAENHGFAVTAGTTNGWLISSESDAVGRSPKLTVQFTTQPVEAYRFQDDNANGYAGTSGIWLRDIDETSDAFVLDQEFIDGRSIDSLDSADDQMVIKFEDVFGETDSQVPTNANIERAWLVLTTGNTSSNSQSRGPYEVHQMLEDWKTTSLYSDFSPDGPTEETGDIGPALGNALGMAADSKQWIDVTEAVKNWQSGDANYGLNVQTGGTADGWQLTWPGSFDAEARPELVVYTTDLGPEGLAGDADKDGDVDTADRTILTQNWTGALPPGEGKKTMNEGDFDMDGDVDGADLTAQVSNWTGAMNAGSAGSGGLADLVYDPATGTLMSGGSLGSSQMVDLSLTSTDASATELFGVGQAETPGSAGGPQALGPMPANISAATSNVLPTVEAGSQLAASVGGKMVVPEPTGAALLLLGWVGWVSVRRTGAKLLL